MYWSTACYVYSSKIFEKSMLTPNPSTRYTVDDGVYGRKYTIGLKIAAKFTIIDKL